MDRFTHEERDKAQELLEVLNQAAEGDSNDAEIQAGHDLADFVRRLMGL